MCTGTVEQSSVAADLDEPGAAGRWGIEHEAVAARVGGVQDPEPVAQALHVGHRRRRAVDQDDVAQHPVHVRLGDAWGGEI
jgi:hypothetical protein